MLRLAREGRLWPAPSRGSRTAFQNPHVLRTSVETSKIAIKVINHYGDEVLEVFDIS